MLFQSPQASNSNIHRNLTQSTRFGLKSPTLAAFLHHCQGHSPYYLQESDPYIEGLYSTETTAGYEWDVYAEEVFTKDS